MRPPPILEVRTPSQAGSVGKTRKPSSLAGRQIENMAGGSAQSELLFEKKKLILALTQLLVNANVVRDFPMK